MTPKEHLRWFDDNVAWFERLRPEHMETTVPSCPGWTVHDVLNHLTFGLGVSYPVATTQPPDTPSEQVFVGIPRPSKYPAPEAASEAFAEHMRACSARFHAADPDAACWTYAGAGTVAFWFRRAAVETTLHRIDVVEAIGGEGLPLDVARAADAIAETLEFALPFAAQMAGAPDGRLRVDSSCLAESMSIGHDSAEATIAGEPTDVLLALWGRHRNRVAVSGDQSVADQWLGLIATAFAGR